MGLLTVLGLRRLSEPEASSLPLRALGQKDAWPGTVCVLDLTLVGFVPPDVIAELC